MNEKIKQPLLSIDPLEFDKFRYDPAFMQILQLSRYINQLLFCYQAYMDQMDEDNQLSPKAIRQSLNSVLFIAGIMYNALDFCTLLGEHFASYECYKEEFVKNILDDPMAEIIKRKEAKTRTRGSRDFQLQLYQNRSQVVFHVDDHPFQTQLEEKMDNSVDYKFTLPEYVFLRGDNTNMFECHFDLTDNLALYWMIGNHGDNELEKEILQEYVEKLMVFAQAFMKAGFNLIGEYSHNMKWKADYNEVK